MSEKNLVICDGELSYANALAENILEREELNVNVHIFSDWEKTYAFSKEQKIHMLLMDEEQEKKMTESIEAEVHFVLVRGEEDYTDEQKKKIYKYQNALHIIREIFEAYVEETDKNVLKGFSQRRTCLEAVYSPVRGIGKTRFAIAWGKELAKKKKVLYLNLEEYPGFEMSGPDETRLDIGDLLYFMKQKMGNLGLHLQAAVQKMGNLDYVPPIYLATDLKEVKAEEWTELLGKIIAMGFYDTIILDLGECVQNLFWILQLCDCIYTPIAEDEISRQKVYRYEQCLERMGLEKILRITQQFVLPQNVEGYVKQRMKEVE